MRKISLKIELNPLIKVKMSGFFKVVKKFRVMEIVHFDLLRGVEILVVEIELKSRFSVKNIEFPNYIEILEILSEKNNKIVCVMKVTYLKENQEFISFFDFELIWDLPSCYEDGFLILSCFGKEMNLKKFIKSCKKLGEIYNIEYSYVNYGRYNSLFNLSEKQKEVIILAKKKGYYEYPRKIDASSLAKILGCSKQNLIEHLRRAENKLINQSLGKF